MNNSRTNQWLPECSPRVTGGLGSLARPAAGWSGGGLVQPGRPVAWPPPSDGLRGRRLPVARPWASKRLPRARQGSHDKQRLPPQTRFPCRQNAMLGRRFCRSRGPGVHIVKNGALVYAKRRFRWKTRFSSTQNTRFLKCPSSWHARPSFFTLHFFVRRDREYELLLSKHCAPPLRFYNVKSSGFVLVKHNF